MAVAVLVAPDPETPAAEKATMKLEAQSARVSASGLLLFPLVAALIGLAIGAADGIVCRVFRRVLLAGFVGLLIGFVGGFVSGIIANLVYAPLTTLAMDQGSDQAGEQLSTVGLLLQVFGRALAWCLAGIAMGLGQGIALRSGKLLLYGFLGGILGGLLGGLSFDPVDLLIYGSFNHPSAHWSRLIGISCVGIGVGLMIGIVELLARDAWLQMVEGPLAGKEFLIFKDRMDVGASPKCDIYLFSDPAVSPEHAVIRTVGGNYEIEGVSRQAATCVNNRPIERARLRHGDQITIGGTVFVFQKRKG